MTWVRLDDNFHWHPKVAPLSDGAYRLYVGGLCYCNRFGSGDCLTLPQILGIVGNIRRANRLISELTTSKLWRKSGDVYKINDYFKYQPDPKKVAAGELGGRISAQARAQASAQAGAQAMLKPRPVPVPVEGKTLSVGSPKPAEPTYGMPKTHMHVEGFHTPSQVLGSLRIQPEPRKEAMS